ncbi:MAG: hypothetical protein J4G03_08045 [Gemmatimonadetes bacterium]|nr:hypothetical protein [Gemmatimonadota bacterium]
MGNTRIRILQNTVLAAGIVVALGARTGAQPATIEVSGEATGNAVALSVERPDGAFDIVLLVDEERPGSVLDGLVDRGFLLQGARGPRSDVVLDLTYARVKWDSQRVGVWQSGSELLEFAVSQESREDDARIVGFGLSHSSAWDVRIPVDGMLAPEFLAGLRTDIVAALAVCEDFDCRAGGGRSTTCSYTCGGETCSQSCGIGYEPCCGCGSDDKPCSRCTAVS